MDVKDVTPRLGLPYLLPNQAQKHVTLNESLARLDSLVMASIAGAPVNTPPPAPVAGRSWLTGAAPTGDWAGQAGQMATFLDGGWQYQTPHAGWIVWDEAARQLRVYTGEDWVALPGGAGTRVLQEIERFGLGTRADAALPFAVRLNQALFAAPDPAVGATGDIRISLNKAAADDTASLVFQTGWSGRGEIGLAGDDRFSLKVSSDGAAWHQGLVLDASAGTVETDFHIVPRQAGQQDVGLAGQPFGDLYLTRAPSITCDARSKRDVAPLARDVATALVQHLQPVQFRHAGAGHLHFGFTAQQVRAALDQAGQGDVFLWRLADPGKADSVQMICQEELISVLVSCLQQLIDRVASLEGPQHAVRQRQSRQ
jgi:hypothetical protein